MAMFFEQDEQKKQAMKEKFFEETIQPYLEIFEHHLKSNNGGKGFFVGNSPTWAGKSISRFSPN